MTQYELADRLGVSASNIAHAERVGLKRTDAIKRYAEALAMSPGELAYGIEESPVEESEASA